MISRFSSKVAIEDGPFIRGALRVLFRSMSWRWRQLSQRRASVAVHAALRRALTLIEPRSANAFRGLAEVQMRRTPSSALDAWSRAVSLEPADQTGRARYAETLWASGQWADSLAVWSEWDCRRRSRAAELRLDLLRLTLFGRTFTKRLGHMALLDMYVKDRLLAAVPLSESMVVTHPEAVANQAYLDYWRKYIRVTIVDSHVYETIRPLLELVEMSAQAWHSANDEIGFYEPIGHRVQRQWENDGRKPLLRLTDEHLERGWTTLQRLGMPRGAWFVVLHVREAAYQPTRNANIATFGEAIQRITGRGGWVVRIGDRMMTPLEPMAQVIDLAHASTRQDWMDVFLLGACRFLVGTQSGPFQVPGTFGVPAIYTNWHPLPYRYWFGSDLMLPKRYWSRSRRRFLTYAEVAGSPICAAMLESDLKREGVELVDNTPEEIEGAVRQMMSRLEGDPDVYDPREASLQERFDALPFKLPYHIPPGGASVARSFLREHADLL
jgi:putative glycosyltransferase (TIGR04372 family)